MNWFMIQNLFPNFVHDFMNIVHNNIDLIHDFVIMFMIS